MTDLLAIDVRVARIRMGKPISRHEIISCAKELLLLYPPGAQLDAAWKNLAEESEKAGFKISDLEEVQPGSSDHFDFTLIRVKPAKAIVH